MAFLLSKYLDILSNSIIKDHEGRYLLIALSGCNPAKPNTPLVLVSIYAPNNHKTSKDFLENVAKGIDNLCFELAVNESYEKTEILEILILWVNELVIFLTEKNQTELT